MRKFKNILITLLLLLCFLNCSHLDKNREIASDNNGQVVIDKNGVWCWFGDPRAIETKEYLYVTWVDNAGRIVVYKKNLKNEKHEKVFMPIKVSINDHDNPSILLLNDGNIMIFYSKHNGDKLHFYKTSTPGNLKSFGKAQSLKSPYSSGKGFTYPNPIAYQENGVEKIILFWRGHDWQPRFSITSDYGKTWSKSKALTNSMGKRPYVKYFMGKSGKIHISMTNGHPSVNYENGIHYMYLKDGEFRRADDSLIGTTEQLPFSIKDLDYVYNPVKDKAKNVKRAWIWSVAEDRKTNPILTYSLTDKKYQHSYIYAYYEKDHWVNSHVTYAGGSIQTPPEQGRRNFNREYYYSGGIFLNQNEPSAFFLSKPYAGSINPNKHQIEKWKFNSRSKTAEFEKKYPTDDPSFRPFVPYLHGKSERQRKVEVLWLSGIYNYYTNFYTQVMGLINE